MNRCTASLGAFALVITGAVGALTAVATPASASKATDLQAANAGLLETADFPQGWTSTPRDASTDADTEKLAKTIPACAEYRALRATTDKETHAKSPEFSLGNSQIDNTVTVFATEKGATAAMKVFDRPSVVKCINLLFTKVFTTSLKSDPKTASQISSIKVKVTPANVETIADATTAYEGTVNITLKDDTTESIGVGIAAVQTGRGIDLFSYVVDTTTVLQLLPTLVDDSVERLTDALA